MNTESRSLLDRAYAWFGFHADTEVDCENNRVVTRWSLIWAAALIASSAIVTSFELPKLLAWTIVFAPNLIALITLRAYTRFLRMTDEFQQRIQLEALAIGFGATYLLAIGHVAAKAAGAPEIDSVFWVLIMTTSWIFGFANAMRRYR